MFVCQYLGQFIVEPVHSIDLANKWFPEVKLRKLMQIFDEKEIVAVVQLRVKFLHKAEMEYLG